MTAYSLGYEVGCDGPDDQGCPASAAIPRQVFSFSAAEVREDGRKLGWTLARRDGRRVDLCPNCRRGAAA